MAIKGFAFFGSQFGLKLKFGRNIILLFGLGAKNDEMVDSPKCDEYLQG